MMSRIDRIRRAVSARKASKVADSWAEDALETREQTLPAISGPPPSSQSDGRDRLGHEAEIIAQLLGQHGERRGLRAGLSLLGFAKAAYYRTEWSGSYDRRARVGRRKRDV